ncbi:ABC-type transport auxiliary lipoprotein family protein [Microbaculum sp. FT89]|uniref:ABC-type transport auxiliary lipoprotein family protein n=1 Tax=Microbaculum sp. FT89 TaxID=3447298 RepID=UPI003F538542
MLSAWRQGVVLALAALVGGCALAAKPAPATYDLTAPTRFPANIGSTAVQFAVTEPTVVGALDSERIVVRPAPTQITYLGKAQWSDRAPKLVQARLIDAFQNTDRVRSVGVPGSAVVSDVGLVTDLRDFHVDAETNTAIVAINVRIVGDQSGRVVASKTFEARQPVADGSVESMVAAMNGAFETVATEIVVWTLAKI